MAKKKEAEKEQNQERWLLTYSDMITLLMLFFIIMYAMSKVEESKFTALAEGLNSAFYVPHSVQMGSFGTAKGTQKKVETANLPQQLKPKSYKFDQAYDILKSMLRNSKAEVRMEERGIVVQLGGDVFFSPGSARVNPGSYQTILDLAVILNALQTRNGIVVEGHTDSMQLDTGSSFYRDNWDLSYHRAYNVFDLLRDYVDEQRMSIVALSNTKPVARGEQPEAKALERRVDIVILRDDSMPSAEPSPQATGPGDGLGDALGDQGAGAQGATLSGAPLVIEGASSTE
jgi:chemotaxis protein MotB